jgi:uncharacterized repeat protein (TIGR01451 family)
MSAKASCVVCVGVCVVKVLRGEWVSQGMRLKGFARRMTRLSLSFALLATIPQSLLPQALAGPAAAPANFTRTTPGAIAATVPDGTCGATITATGGAGGSQTAGGTGGRGGGGATINANFKVLPLQNITGTVAQGGQAASGAGTGQAAGGSGGTAPSGHRGAGGGGSTAVIVAGTPVVIAGGGGGGGGVHTSVGNGGGGGSTGIAAGIVAVGVNGAVGEEVPALTSAPGGGQGGQAAAGGAGGINANDITLNGAAGGGTATGTGGNGGPDPSYDAGGGGGGGYTGGGGGSSTVGVNSAGAGGGGGSSFVRATAPTVAAPAPTTISGTTGVATAAGATNGANGSASVTWLPCNYQLTINKSATPTPVRAGAATVWTVSVTNNGPDPMTRGDTITLTDTLPAGPNGTAAIQYRVLSIASAGGTNTDMSSGAIACTGVSVGATMPGSTDCSRPYTAPSAPGAPTGGTRGLNVGETLTITYEQVISNKAPCGTITNTAATADRSTAGAWGQTARNVNATLTMQCYDLAVAKTASPTTVGTGNPIDWSITVTNSGTADMMGPTDTTSNPLVVNDVAPTTNVAAPTLFTSSGPAGACTYAAGVITCPGSLAQGQSQTFTFRQIVNAAAPNGAVIANTASATDFNPGDTNDSATASATTAAALPGMSINKTSSLGTVSAAGTVVTYSIRVNNTGNTLLGPITVADPLGTVVCPVSGNATIATLAAGTNQICTLSYTVPQTVLNTNGGGDGDIDNTATASATYSGNPVTANGSAAVLLTISPALTITKTPSTAGPVNASNTIGYTYRITNTGNVTVNNVTVADVHNGYGTDPVPGGESLFTDVAPLGDSTDAAVNGTWTSLAPGDTVQFTSSYIVVQADIDNLQ